ncbi:MAG: hypothetical protein AAGK23_03685 [Pseudomonadota bacterium]
MIYEYIALAALGFGAFAGLSALLNPDGIAATLRLQATPEKPGGYAEFRATFGGVFLMIHLTAIAIILHTPPIISVFVALPIAAAWLGAAIARLLSMVVDKSKNGEGGNNRYWVILELVVFAMIASIALQIL